MDLDYYINDFLNIFVNVLSAGFVGTRMVSSESTGSCVAGSASAAMPRRLASLRFVF